MKIMIYTPRLKSEERLSLVISREEGLILMSYGRRRGFKGIATDTKTNKRYRIYGASCGSPHCMCDAIAKPEEGDTTRKESA